jgi:hypothetical protein
LRLLQFEWDDDIYAVAKHKPEDVRMAETTKLSVGQALEKLRGTDVRRSKMTQLDNKIDELDKEAQRLRAERRRLERDQRSRLTKSD